MFCMKSLMKCVTWKIEYFLWSVLFFWSRREANNRKGLECTMSINDARNHHLYSHLSWFMMLQLLWWSICKENQRMDKGGEHWCGVGQRPYDNQVRNLWSMLFGFEMGWFLLSFGFRLSWYVIKMYENIFKCKLN